MSYTESEVEKETRSPIENNFKSTSNGIVKNQVRKILIEIGFGIAIAFIVGLFLWIDHKFSKNKNNVQYSNNFQNTNSLNTPTNMNVMNNSNSSLNAINNYVK